MALGKSEEKPSYSESSNLAGEVVNGQCAGKINCRHLIRVVVNRLYEIINSGSDRNRLTTMPGNLAMRYNWRVSLHYTTLESISEFYHLANGYTSILYVFIWREQYGATVSGVFLAT